MIDKIREELLRCLTSISILDPEIRMGQLLANLSFFATEGPIEAIWEIEDDRLLAVAREHEQNLLRRANDIAA